MQLITTIIAIRAFSRQAHRDGKTVGLVPTMGALHEGHLSLVRRSKSQCDTTVVSIFVNPSQFGPAEDFARYPRDPGRDVELLETFNIDALFAPDPTEIYPPGFSTWIEPGPVARSLEGEARPGHFRGVATIVLKLFNVIDPDLVFFGQKDLQQAAVIRQLVTDLGLRAQLVVCPTVRGKDGVALSSRNAYLSADERRRAESLNRSLESARRMVWSGETDARRIIEEMRSVLASDPRVSVDYVALVDPVSFQPVERARTGTAALVAARVGSARLIDNTVFGPPEATEEQLLHAVQNAARMTEGPVHAPGLAVESLKRQIESCRDCAAISSVVLPPREFLAKYLKSDYADLSAVHTLVIGRDAPWNADNYLYRNPAVKDRFTDRLFELVGVRNFADFKTRSAITDSLRCHVGLMPLPERALENCARHLACELRLFPNLRAIVLLGEDSYIQFQRWILGRKPREFAPFSQLLAKNGWASEEVHLDGAPGRPLRLIYCRHPTRDYQGISSIAHLLD